MSGFLKDEGVPREDVAVIGFHGQTVLHRAPQAHRRGATRQLGDGELMARLTDIDVVYDFRSADVKAGGQGAPLAPIYHAALLRRAGVSPNSAVLADGGRARFWNAGGHTGAGPGWPGGTTRHRQGSRSHRSHGVLGIPDRR